MKVRTWTTRDGICRHQVIGDDGHIETWDTPERLTSSALRAEARKRLRPAPEGRRPDPPAAPILVQPPKPKPAPVVIDQETGLPADYGVVDYGEDPFDVNTDGDWPWPDSDLYTTDPAIGQRYFDEALLDERHAQAERDTRLAELEAEWGPRPLNVTYIYRRHARGGGEMGPVLRWMSTDRVRDRIRVLVNQPGEGMAQWMRGLGMTVEPWGDPSVAVSGNPDVVRMMLYTRADSVVVPPGAALVGEKVNIKPLDLDPRVAERLDAVTALSPAARAMLAGTRWADAPIVPYGVPQSPMMVGQREAWRAELRADLGIADTATVAIWCGRMQAVEKYLAALREAIEATPEVHWLVIGYFQSGFERYRDDWLRWSVGRPITWIEDAYPDRAARLCYAGDFAVSTSSSEGLSLAVVDAVAAGLPVVASDSGGVRHAVISGITGYLTPHEDTARLVAAVQRMAEMEPTVRRDMGVVFGQQLAAARFDGREYARACRVVDLEAALGRRPYAVEPVPPSDAGEDAPAAEPCEPPDPPASAAELEGRRIAWFFDRPVTGGLLWRAAVLAAVLRKAGVQTSLAFGRRAQNDILDWARDHGVEVTARPEEVDLLHVGWPPIPPAWCDAPMVTWVAGSAVRPLLERPEAARWARLVMVHESMSAHVPEALADRAVTIHNAVPPEWYQPAGETEPAILCVGRWNDPVKRLPDVCQAVEAMPDARFILVGAVRDGYVPAALREALSTGRVRWLPRVSPMQMPAIYRQATIYWQPSLDEGYPVAALEAQAAGLALVLTDTGGSREVVGACNGYLVPDFRTGLQRLRELWAKPALARALGENSRGAATAGGRWEAYLHGYLALYQSLLEE